MVSLDRCDRSCNTDEDPFGRVCVPNTIEDVNLKVLTTIKRINESKTLVKHISCQSGCEFDDIKCNSKQNRNDKKC